MFKSTSDNIQSRLHRETEFGRHNEAGVDPAAFKENDDVVARLKRQLHETECEIAIIDQRLKTRPHNAIGEALHDKLSRQRDEAVIRVKQTQMDLRDAKEVRKELVQQSRRVNKLRFEQEFMHMAHELLARDVYKRIFNATIHRMSDVMKFKD